MKSRRIENLKTLLLVVLFLTTILLLYLLWMQKESRGFSVSDILGYSKETVITASADSVIKPDYAAYSSGDGSFRMVSGGTLALQEHAISIIKAGLENSGAAVSEISREQYYTAISSYSSFLFKTCVDFPTADFASYFGFNNASSLGSVTHISSIAFSDAAKESVFISDEIVGKYYRVLFEEGGEWVSELLKGAMLSGEIYYLSGAVLGGSGKALIPLYTSSKLDYCEYRNEHDEGGRDLRSGMAEAVFGENFDFVRRLTDSFGNITYMYGYGQKVFIANADGSFDYSSEVSGSYSKDFFTDLETALTFASECGGWKYSGGESGFMLSGYEVEGTGRACARTFSFVQQVEGETICSESGPAIQITVDSGQVSHMSRNVAVVAAPQYSVDTFEITDAANVVAENCNHIYNILNSNTLAAEADEAFSFASDAVSQVGIAYFRSSKDEIMSPCWRIDTSEGAVFYFDLYTASPLGFTR